MSIQCPKCGSANVKLEIGDRIKSGPYHYAQIVCMDCGNKSKKIRVKPANDIAKNISDASVLEA